VGTWSFLGGGVKRPGRGVDHPPPSSAEVKERIELYEALNTIYKGAILPLMLYGAPIWIGAMVKKCNKLLYTRVQHSMNIKIAKAYRTTSGEALCVLSGLTPIEIKAAETARLYQSQETDKTDNWTTYKSRRTGPIRQT
jgi:hypothetical protein